MWHVTCLGVACDLFGEVAGAAGSGGGVSGGTGGSGLLTQTACLSAKSPRAIQCPARLFSHPLCVD